MSENTSKGRQNDGENPKRKKIKVHPIQDLLRNLKILLSREFKTGSIKCNNAIVTLDCEKVDLLNVNSRIISKIQFEESSTAKAETHLKRPLEKRLENLNIHFLHYLGQFIATELGTGCQAIPHKFIIYEKNHFSSPNENIQEENLSNFLIIVCKTNCDGGVIHFPEFRKTFSPQSGNYLNYVYFGKNTQYKVSKITKGFRVLIVYKIFHNPLQLESKNLIVDNEDIVKNILNNLNEKNILIPVTEPDIVKTICEKISVNCIEVCAEDKCPNIVFDNVINEVDEYEDEMHTFASIVDDENKYLVGTFVDLQEPEMSYEELKYYGPDFDHDCHEPEPYKIEFFKFNLINPDKNFRR